MSSAETDAQRLLDDVWRRAVPVDPILIARELGLGVFVADLEAGWSGALVKRAYEDAAIYLNRYDSANRQRFSCAHELGHYYRRKPTDDEAYEYVDRRDQNARSGKDPDEIYANQFAAGLLMPSDEVIRKHAESPSVHSLAYHFGVSAEAMAIRLATLGAG